MKDFRRLKVWGSAHELVLKVYAATRRFPREELFGMTSQMRRSSASIPYNIAEGCGMGTDAAFANSLQISFASSCELDYQLILARDLGYLSEAGYSPLEARVRDVQRMLNAFLARLRRDR